MRRRRRESLAAYRRKVQNGGEAAAARQGRREADGQEKVASRFRQADRPEEDKHEAWTPSTSSVIDPNNTSALRLIAGLTAAIADEQETQGTGGERPCE